MLDNLKAAGFSEDECWSAEQACGGYWQPCGSYRHRSGGRNLTTVAAVVLCEGVALASDRLAMHGRPSRLGWFKAKREAVQAWSCYRFRSCTATVNCPMALGRDNQSGRPSRPGGTTAFSACSAALLLSTAQLPLVLGNPAAGGRLGLEVLPLSQLPFEAVQAWSSCTYTTGFWGRAGIVKMGPSQLNPEAALTWLWRRVS